MRALPFLVAATAACGSSTSNLPRDGSLEPDAAAGELAEIHRTGGRFDGDGAFAWPGTTIRTRFAGTEIALEMEDSGGNQFEVWIDGEAQPVLLGATCTTTLASGLADGEHDLVITRRTESFFGPTRIVGFPGATLIETPAPTRLIELVGDSITCGYGVLGDGPGCPFSADTEAETRAWGGLAAAELDAAHVAIAYSGKGLIRNYGGDASDTMPLLYERIFADDPGSTWSFTGEHPDVVVVGLGTNDFSIGDPGDAFAEAMTDFVAQIRGHHPDAWIVLASSPMLGGADHETHRGYLEDAIAAAGDDRLRYLEIAVQADADGYGCDWHPSDVTAGKMATALVAEIRELTGW
jgi:lysophospholipase L1-like esterase